MAICSDIVLPEVARAIEKEGVVLSAAVGPEQSEALPAATLLMANWIERAGCAGAAVSRRTSWL